MIVAPNWFRDLMPKDLALDGELCYPESDFRAVLRVIKGGSGDKKAWQKVKFVAYDTPLVDNKFSLRLKLL